MGNWYVSKPDNDGERELINRAVKALEAEFATKTCNKQITSKLEYAELARDSEETCNNKQVISKLVASDEGERMTIEEAIMVLKNEQPHCGKKALFPEEKKYEAYNRAIKALEQEPRWIPVSERLPEERDWYLAVFKEKDTGYQLIPRVADYIGNGENKWRIIDEDGFWPEYWGVMECVAWMPLPERYEPQESETGMSEEMTREEIAALLARGSEEMTREDAIEELSILLNKYQDGNFGDALDRAIEDVDKCDKIEKIINSNDADFISNYVKGLFAE